MEVKLEEMVGKSMYDPKKDVRPKLWRVRVDGKHAGFMGWKKDSKFLPYLTFSPAELAHIEKEISRLVAEMTDKPEVKVESAPAPKFVPMVKDDEEGFDDSDFDT